MLSLVRLTPDTGVVGGFDTTRTGPAPDPATADSGGSGYPGSDQATTTAATHLADPERTPSAPSALGGTDGAAATVPIPTATASPTHTGIGVPGTTTIPQAPNPPSPPKATNAPQPNPEPPQNPKPKPKPKPTAAPAPTTGTPAPDHSDDPGLCLPVIDLCLSRLG